MKHYNYQSDFKIVEPLRNEAPFRFTYYIKKCGKSIVAEYSGGEFTNCFPREGQLIIPVDGGALGIGEIFVKREYFLNDADFADGFCNLVTDKVPTDIELWRGQTDSAEEVEVSVSPAYHTIVIGGDGGVQSDWAEGNPQSMAYIKNKPVIPSRTSQLTNDSGFMTSVADGSITESKLSEEVKEKLNQAGGAGADGKSAYEIWLEQGNEGSEQDFLDSLKGEKGEKGDKMTYDDLSEEEKDDLASRVPVPDVNLSEYAKKSEVPTKTSQLTNDSGFVTEERVEEMIEDKVTSANVTNIVTITQADYDTLETKSETTLYLITE